MRHKRMHPQQRLLLILGLLFPFQAENLLLDENFNIKIAGKIIYIEIILYAVHTNH